jgi:hypothetical protein
MPWPNNAGRLYTYRWHVGIKSVLSVSSIKWGLIDNATQCKFIQTYKSTCRFVTIRAPFTKCAQTLNYIYPSLYIYIWSSFPFPGWGWGAPFCSEPTPFSTKWLRYTVSILQNGPSITIKIQITRSPTSHVHWDLGSSSVKPAFFFSLRANVGDGWRVGSPMDPPNKWTVLLAY